MKNKLLIGLTIVILLIILRFCFPSKYSSNDELNDLQKLVNDEKVIKKIENICLGKGFKNYTSGNMGLKKMLQQQRFNECKVGELCKEVEKLMDHKICNWDIEYLLKRTTT